MIIRNIKDEKNHCILWSISSVSFIRFTGVRFSYNSQSCIVTHYPLVSARTELAFFCSDVMNIEPNERQIYYRAIFTFLNSFLHLTFAKHFHQLSIQLFVQEPCHLPCQVAFILFNKHLKTFIKNMGLRCGGGGAWCQNFRQPTTHILVPTQFHAYNLNA